MWASTFLSPYLHPISSVLNSKLRKSPHQCRVRIGLYTISSRRGLRMGYRITKGVSERCIARLLLTLFWFYAMILYILLYLFIYSKNNKFIILNGDIYAKIGPI